MLMVMMNKMKRVLHLLMTKYKGTMGFSMAIGIHSFLKLDHE
jgi:hypothetical protein